MQLQGYNLIWNMETWWGSSLNSSAAMGGYRLIRNVIVDPDGSTIWKARMMMRGSCPWCESSRQVMSQLTAYKSESLGRPKSVMLW